MEKTFKESCGLWELSTDKAHILHRKGSYYYTEIRRATVTDPDDWEEVAAGDIPAYTRNEYETKVDDLIRRRYSASEEFAIQRKMLNALMPQTAALDGDAGTAAFDADKAIAEYAEYNAYAEQCKAEAPAAIAEYKAWLAAEMASREEEEAEESGTESVTETE